MTSAQYKKLFVAGVLGGALTVLSPAHGLAAEIPGDSKITAVTVYPGSARVTRTVNVDLSQGEHSIVLDNIIPRIDENTLMVTGKGSAQVKIFGAAMKRDYSQKPADERVTELQDQIEEIGDDINQQNQVFQILNKESQYLDSIKLFSGNQIPKDLVTTMPTAENLEGVRNFLVNGYADIEKRREDTRLTIRDLKREQAALQKKLNELRSYGSSRQRQLAVDLECSKSGAFSLEVSYLVHGAYWRSLYDARAQYNEGKVELTSFGVVKQTTGEDWVDVALTLSTAQPTMSGRLPYVSPWILQPHQPYQERKAMRKGAKNRAMPQAQFAPFMDSLGASSEMAVMEEDVAADLAYSNVQQKGVSITYEITRLATIKSDGSETKYPMTTQTLEANFEYSSYPRVKPFAYLGSRVTNSEDVQLLAGQINLFLDGDYIGKSSIDNIGPGEEFNLYLGIDESVKVKREQISRKVDDVLLGGIKSPNIKTTIENKFTVENLKGKQITMHLFEAMPVSQDERIKVKVYDVSQKATDQDWEDRKGVWRWEFPMKKKQEKEITYKFSVDHPRDVSILGL